MKIYYFESFEKSVIFLNFDHNDDIINKKSCHRNIFYANKLYLSPWDI